MIENFDTFDLSGKTAFVTGGGRGLGYYMARGLARSGAKVMLAARTENVLQEAAEKISAETGNDSILYQTIDLCDRNNIESSAKQANKKLGGVDIFIGNAGQEAMERLEVMDDETSERIYRINVFANMSLVKQFIPHMRKNKWGRVIFSSSVCSRLGSGVEGFNAYAGAKSAINGFVRNAAIEAGRGGVTFNSIIIGMFMTDMVKQTLGADTDAGQTVEDMTNMTGLGRMGDPAELEGIVRLLASDAGSYITGTAIPVDGGLTVSMKPTRS